MRLSALKSERSRARSGQLTLLCWAAACSGIICFAVSFGPYATPCFAVLLGLSSHPGEDLPVDMPFGIVLEGDPGIEHLAEEFSLRCREEWQRQLLPKLECDGFIERLIVNVTPGLGADAWRMPLP